MERDHAAVTINGAGPNRATHDRQPALRQIFAEQQLRRLNERPGLDGLNGRIQPALRLTLGTEATFRPLPAASSRVEHVVVSRPSSAALLDEAAGQPTLPSLPSPGLSRLSTR